MSNTVADLHLHSVFSDGTLTPEEVVSTAERCGLRCISITDHDTVDGILSMDRTRKVNTVEVIPGIEISTIMENGHSEVEVHILGYFIDVHSAALHAFFKEQVEARRRRAVKMVEKLAEIGCPVDFERVEQIASGKVITRPHIAQALVEKGYISSVREAFSKEFIAQGGRAYVEREKVSPERAIRIVHEAGGIAVIAHPGALQGGGILGKRELLQLKEKGADGIEVFYAYHSAEQVHLYRNIAEEMDMILTGGSDFHGDFFPETWMGKGGLDEAGLHAFLAAAAGKSNTAAAFIDEHLT